MPLYTYQGRYPCPLPFRIKLSNGQTRTDPTTFTEEELQDVGYTAVPDKPIVDSSKIVEWISDELVWSIRDKTEGELAVEIAQQWGRIREVRDQKIQEIEWRYERYHRHQRLEISQVDNIADLDQYVQALADIPQTQTDPFNIVWPELS
jgi:hypothetical protein